MTEHNEKSAGREEQTAPTWTPVHVANGRVILRRTDVSAEEPTLIRKARKSMEELEDTIRRMEDKGWTVEESEVSGGGYGKLLVKGGQSVIEESPKPRVSITATTTVEGHRIRYTLTPESDEWGHFLESPRPDCYLGRCAPAPHVMSPETALRLLDEGLLTDRSYEEYELWQEFVSECGPGEEPDREEFKRVLKQFRRGELSGERRDAGDGSFGDGWFDDEDEILFEGSGW